MKDLSFIYLDFVFHEHGPRSTMHASSSTFAVLAIQNPMAALISHALISLKIHESALKEVPEVEQFCEKFDMQTLVACRVV